MMSETVPRTCTVVALPSADGLRTDPRPPQPDSRPLGDFRACDAYVLLGDPGAGKTTAFEDEADALGDKAYPVVSARDFLELEDPSSLPAEKTLFIDGLDEVRAGQRDARSPFDQIRKRLQDLGRPRFRLSCREADWLGENDQRHLAKVSPSGEVTVLRLDPLTESDVHRVLASHADVIDSEEFVSTARDRGVGGLLPNPQTLIMLADVVGDGDEWPDGRLATFEKACLRVVFEHNEEHRASTNLGDIPTPDELLDGAGRLGAVHLLTGTAGFSLLQVGDDIGFIDPSRCGYELGVLRSVLATKLFRAQSDGLMIPVHRHVAEYLAARHLARLVDRQRLPARRVVALLAGDDGTVVTEMRGLSAWLAAHCRAVRPHLIDRDPIGVGQYGDVCGFGHQERRDLLETLGREVPKRDLELAVAASFRALATPDMECAFEDVLSNQDRNREHQAFVEFVLRILIESTSLPGLSATLLRIVGDATWWSSVRTWALDAFYYSYSGQDKAELLKALLTDIRQGAVADPDDDLLGTLLEHLYPQELSSRELWHYFSRQQSPDRFGRYRWFWEAKLVERSTDADVLEHLDYLSQRPDRRGALLYVDGYRRLRLGFVARGLAVHGDSLVAAREIPRLYDWLGVASGRDRDDLGDEDPTLDSIRAWLVERPEVQKALILEGLRRCRDGDGFRASAFDVQERLYQSILPPDFGLWCLNQATASVDEKPQTGKHFLELAFISVPNDRINRGLSRERLEGGVNGNEVLESYLNVLRSSPSIPERYEEERRKDQEYFQARGKERQEELEQLRANEIAFRENRASAAWLYNLAKIYFGSFMEFCGDKGRKAIEKRLRGDQSLAEAVFAGFRLAVGRSDLPAYNEILRAHKQKRVYYLSLPFLAGLEEEEGIEPVDSPRWDESRIRTAIAFYYTTAHGDYEPSWYRRLVAQRPEIVAEVQARIAPLDFRSNRLVDCDVWNLAHDPNFAQVARHSALRLLSAVPTRCNLKHRESLDQLLWAAFQHSDKQTFQELIAAKLARSSMSRWQRVHWLAAAVAVAPDVYGEELRGYIQGSDQGHRLSHLAAFFCPRGRVASLFANLRPEHLASLILLFGTSVGPDQFADLSGYVIPKMDTSLLVRNLIQELRSASSAEASSQFNSLVKEAALAGWRDELRRAGEAQRIVRRDEGYRHPDVDQVCRTLRGAEPANVADLAALVVDHLQELATEIQRGDADGWRAFWSEGEHRESTTPKSEESCRDAIIRGLRRSLPAGVDVQAEARHARANRSDLRVSYLGTWKQRAHIPIEIKKKRNRDLWTSIEDQLIKKYTIDPSANGYGIYLVLWFGRLETQPPSNGNRPDSPEELENRLRATLSADQARRISICIVDVSGDAPDPG